MRFLAPPDGSVHPIQPARKVVQHQALETLFCMCVAIVSTRAQGSWGVLAARCLALPEGLSVGAIWAPTGSSFMPAHRQEVL